MFPTSLKVNSDFNWMDLDKKFVKIRVVEPNPEVLEFTGQVFAMDEKGTVYLLHEWHILENK